MSTDYTLEDVVFKTVHHNDKGVSIEDIATGSATGLNHLYRMANKEDACNMPASKLVPIMNVTEDYRILDFLAKKTGHLAIRMPRGIRKGTDPKMDLSQYQKEFSELFQMLIDFVNEPSDEKLAEVDDKMRKHIGDSVNIKRRCKSHQMHQRELKL
jgi:hypothetical protein